MTKYLVWMEEHLLLTALAGLVVLLMAAGSWLIIFPKTAYDVPLEDAPSMIRKAYRDRTVAAVVFARDDQASKSLLQSFPDVQRQYPEVQVIGFMDCANGEHDLSESERGKLGISWPVYRMTPAVRRSLTPPLVGTLPAVILFDRHGVVLDSFVGAISAPAVLFRMASQREEREQGSYQDEGVFSNR